MEGSFFGNVAALAWFLAFQAGGALLAACFFGTRERRAVQLLLGSAAGSVLAMWLPALFAFFCGFTVLAQLLALALLAAAVTLALWKCRPALALPKGFWRQSPMLLVPLSFLLLFTFLVLHGFRTENGAVYSSQCTYGDMSMHLGFITSIAEQGTFPPEYSILPGTKLSYPFLSDSISSSLHVFGASLQLSYVLPMLAAGAQVFFGAWLLLGRVLRDGMKRLAAFLLFFLNGGLGIVYFMDGLPENLSNFTRIFTAFYETPTNLVEQNIRWVNVIVDILVPQRASLFGWAVLFPLLYVLYRAAEEGERRYFPVAGVFAGGMVMIHTHSFLALGLICGVWLVFALCKPERRARGALMRTVKRSMAVLLLLCFAVQFLVPNVLARDSWVFLALVLVAALAFVLLLLWMLLAALRRGAGQTLLATWGVFLGITLLVAVPQLLTWTFTQAQGQQFVRGWYNWGNLSDGYLWFYLKNLGVMAVLALPALFSARGRLFRAAAPAVLIWFVCEFIVFQPNTYDNNKLLYVAYFLLCIPASSFLVDGLRAIRMAPQRWLATVGVAMLCTVGAVLTIARESVARYELYGTEAIATAQYIEENTAPDDTVLTHTNHNNAIAALSGRNIVCGSSTYVYFHGLDYTQRERDVAALFERPAENAALFEQYSVDYVLVSDHERANYAVDEDTIASLFELCYAQGGTRIYKVTTAQP